MFEGELLQMLEAPFLFFSSPPLLPFFLITASVPPDYNHELVRGVLDCASQAPFSIDLGWFFLPRRPHPCRSLFSPSLTPVVIPVYPDPFFF